MRLTISAPSILILLLGSTCAELTHRGSLYQKNTTTESEGRRTNRRRRQHRLQREVVVGDVENVHADTGVVSSSSDSDKNTDVDRLLKKIHAKELGYHAIKVEAINVNEKGWRGEHQEPMMSKGKGKGEGGILSKSTKASKKGYKCGKSRKSSKGSGKGSSKYNRSSPPTESPTSLPSCSPAPSYSAEPSSYPSSTPTYEPTTLPSTGPTEVPFDLDVCETYEDDW